MTDSEPGGTAPGPPGPPARPPGPVPDGYVPLEWVQTASAAAAAAAAATGAGGPVPPPPPQPPPALLAYDPTFSVLPPPPTVLPVADVPFLDTPWVPPQTTRQGWLWLVYAVVGFLVGQIGAEVFGLVAGVIAGKTTAQITLIQKEAVPPEW